MNILMILDGEFPHDDRVEKEALSLISEGNNIFLLCLNYGSFKKNENYKGIEITRIHICKSFRNKLQALYLIFPFYRLLWKKHIKHLIAQHSVNVLHVHDLPLSDLVIELRKKYPLKIVCDQHEFYSSWIVKTTHYNTFAGKIISLFSNWVNYEKQYLPLADLVVTVESPLRDLYITARQVDQGKIAVLPNTPSSTIFNPDNIDHTIVNKYRENFVLLYTGHIDILRGINTIIESLPLIRNSIPNFKFILAGKFNKKYYDPLKYSQQLGVDDLIEYHEWVPLNLLPSYITASSVCIHIPPSVTREVNSTIASKIYQNIVMNKPTIVGQASMMKDFIEKNEIGISIKESDPADLAEKLKLLYNNPELIRTFVNNTKLISERYFWEVTSESFLRYYKSFQIEPDTGYDFQTLRQ